MFFKKDPYDPDSRNVLTAGEWLVMLFFVLMCVLVGLLMFKQWVIEPFIYQQISPTDEKKKP